MIATMPHAKPMTDAERARRELARRDLAAISLVDFCAYIDPDTAINPHDPFVHNLYRSPHLQLIASYLEQAEAGTLWDNVPGDGKRILIITTPPRHWKSSLVSRKFPAWFVGKRHKNGQPHQVILTSYAAGLAESNSRSVLETIMDNKRFGNIFPKIRISQKSHAMEEWALEGEPFPTGVAAGVGGGLTGKGGDVVIIDDPVKDRAEANSPAVRKRLWEWWQDVARTRINPPNGFCVIVMTRWHPDDLVGRLLAQNQKEGEEHERIVHVRLPALAESDVERMQAHSMGLPLDDADPLGRQPGEALWPAIQPAAEHLATKKVTPLTFNALFQGCPTPEGGYMVGRENFKMLPYLPEKDVVWVWGTDWAIKEKEAAPVRKGEPDYTVAALVGLWTPEGNKEDARIVIAQVHRGQHNIHDARRLVKRAALAGPKGAMIVGVDKEGQIAIDYLALDGLRRDPELFAFRVKSLNVKGDKVTRAQPWLDRTHGRMVYVVEGVWNEAFFTEMENFPHGANDDQADAVSAAVHGLGVAGKPRNVSSQRMSFYG